jgi:hypothetical protein
MKVHVRRAVFVGMIVLGLAVMPLLPGSGAEAADVIKWRMQVLWDAATLPYAIEKTFVDRVKELTGGRRRSRSLHPARSFPPTRCSMPSRRACSR